MAGESIQNPGGSKEQLEFQSMIRDFAFATPEIREQNFPQILNTLKDRRFLSQKAVENLCNIVVNELPKHGPAIREALEEYFDPYFVNPPYVHIPSMPNSDIKLNHTKNTPYGINLTTGKIDFTYEYNGQTMRGDRNIVALLEEFENAKK